MMDVLKRIKEGKFYRNAQLICECKGEKHIISLSAGKIILGKRSQFEPLEKKIIFPMSGKNPTEIAFVDNNEITKTIHPKHAELIRQSNGKYVLIANYPVAINNKSIELKKGVELEHEDQILLGTALIKIQILYSK